MGFSQSTKVKLIDLDEQVKYLGVPINPIKGINTPPVLPRASTMLARISATSLRPTQKLTLLKHYGIPGLIYQADQGMTGIRTLRDLDRNIRTAIKKWLKLDPSTTNRLLYARARDGGLGILKLESQIPILQLKRLLNILQSPNFS